MKDPKIKTKVVHSQSKAAWNVVGITLTAKYKIARCPYIPLKNGDENDINRIEAREHAEFISFCFNNSEVMSMIRELSWKERKDLLSEDQLRGRVPDKNGLFQGDFGNISPFTDAMIHYWLNCHGVPRITIETVK